MALFTTDYSKNEEKKFAPVPEGDYEVTIDKAGMDATKGGTEYLGITLRIRDDLDKALPETNGKYHKRLIFVSFWKNKQTGKLNPTDIMRVMQAAGIPEGTDIESWDAFDDMLHDKPVKVHVKVDEYNGNKRNTVASWDFKKTEFPTNTNGAEDPFKESKEAVVKEEELPF